MTKKESKKILIKDIIIILVAFVCSTAVVVGMGEDMYMAVLAGVFFSGIPFGWRWLSKVFISLGWFMVLVKLTLSIILGWIALPVVLIKDIVVCVKAE